MDHAANADSILGAAMAGIAAAAEHGGLGAHDGHGGHDGHSAPGGGEHGGHGGHSGHGGSGVCNASMTFSWDPTDLCIVFEWWHITSTIQLIISLLVIVALSAGYEYVRWRVHVLDRAVANSANTRESQRWLRAAGYAFQVGYSFFLMLVFMTYNGFAMLAVVVGAGIGFWFWGDRASRDVSCH